MSIINVTNLTYAYDGSYDYVFENASFRLDTSWRLGFTGRNGRGKTTFLRLLCGAYEYSGSIISQEAFEYFPYAPPPDDADGWRLAASVCPGAQEWEIERELNMLDTGADILERPFSTLSGGEQTKIMLALFFLKDGIYPLIDEPTNHLDARGREVLGTYLRGKPGFILVSHDRALLDACTDHTLSINRTGIEITRGSFSVWMENKERRDAFEASENEKIKREIERLKQTSREKAKWADTAESRKIGFDPAKTEKSMGRRAFEGAKSKKLMKRAKSIGERIGDEIEKKEALLKDTETAAPLKLRQTAHYSDRLAVFEDTDIFYGDYAAVTGLSLEIRRGDRLAVCGGNGCGKSTILKLLCGEKLRYTGGFWTAGGLRVSYVSQDTSGLSGNLRAFAEESGVDESLFKAVLRKLDFSRAQFDKDIGEFSAGQKKKVLIARSLCEDAHILVWDEPLNYIDVLSRIQIEELLLGYEPTVVFVEHDAVFCGKVATRTIRL